MKILISFLLFFLQSYFINAQEPLTTYLTWERNPESTMTIYWITQKGQNGDTVAYSEAGRNEWIFGVGRHWDYPDGKNYSIHSVELNGLRPNTVYQFKIENEPQTYKFQTMPSDLKMPIRFVVGGDMYHDGLEILEKTNRMAASQNPMFALIGGDIAYAYSSSGSPKKEKNDRWLDFLISWKNTMVTKDGIMIPIIPALGNHDVDQKLKKPQDKAKYFMALFTKPGSRGYHLLDFSGYMTIFLLDSGHANPVKGDQTEWLNQNLGQRTEFTHKFALYHVPAWPSVRSLSDPLSVQVRLHWVPLFEKHELDIAFENHNHAYKRTPRIFKGKVDPEKGVVYIGDGAWGVGQVRKPKSAKKEWYLAKTAQERHFVLVTLTGSEQNIKAINSDGVTIDEISSVRQAE